MHIVKLGHVFWNGCSIWVC